MITIRIRGTEVIRASRKVSCALLLCMLLCRQAEDRLPGPRLLLLGGEVVDVVSLGGRRWIKRREDCERGLFFSFVEAQDRGQEKCTVSKKIWGQECVAEYS